MRLEIVFRIIDSESREEHQEKRIFYPLNFMFANGMIRLFFPTGELGYHEGAIIAYSADITDTSTGEEPHKDLGDSELVVYV